MRSKKFAAAVLSSAIAVSCAAAAPVHYSPVREITASAAYEVTEGAVTYTIYDNYAEVTQVNVLTATFLGIDLKSSVSGVPVTAIGDKAFYLFTSSMINNLKIPSSITEIEGTFLGGAFSGCIYLETITIPKNVSSIGQCAFNTCSSLTSITIEDPNCYIYDSARTICNGTDDNGDPYYDGVIYGYKNSTAQKYAEKYGYKFAEISNGSGSSESPSEPVIPSGYGDVDGNETVDASDASAILVEYAALSTGQEPTLNSLQKIAADVNFDDAIDSSDASTVLVFYSYSSTGGTITDMEEWLSS